MGIVYIPVPYTVLNRKLLTSVKLIGSLTKAIIGERTNTQTKPLSNFIAASLK